MKPSDAHPSLQTLIDLADGCAALTPALSDHVDSCPRCTERLRVVADQGLLLRRLAADMRSGEWRGADCLDRVCSSARGQWRALARLLVLATLRGEARQDVLLRGLPACLPPDDLRQCLARLSRRLGAEAVSRRNPPREPTALLRWLRRVDGPGPWWQLLSAVSLITRGRRAAAVRQARRAHTALTLFAARGDAERGLVTLSRSLMAQARGAAPRGAAGQEPSAIPSLRDSLAPR